MKTMHLNKWFAVTILSFIAFGWISCGRSKIGTSAYKDPSLDKSPFKQADEFTYLVDLDLALQRLAGGLESTKSLPSSEADTRETLDLTAIAGISKKSISAEANNSMIRARAEYEVSEKDNVLPKLLGEIEAVEVKFPAHFPRERWIGHLFIGNPGIIVQNLVKQVEQGFDGFKNSQSGASLFSLDSTLGLLGIGKKEDLYNWIGDEMLICAISNPGYDPQGKQDFRNTPLFSIIAIASSSPEKGLEIADKLASALYMFMGEPEGYQRTQLKGYEALFMPAPDVSLSPFAEFMPKEEAKQLSDLPATVVAVVPGYLILGDQVSVEKALEIFKKDIKKGTARLASVEAEVNLDLLSQSYTPSNPGFVISMLNEQSPELQDLLKRIYMATKDIKELGPSRYTVINKDKMHFELECMTSRESIKFYDAIRKVVEETPSETWQKIGEEISGKLIEQSGMADMSGEQNFSFQFEGNE